MVHIRIFHAVFREASLLKLPLEMVPTVFEHMKKCCVVIGVSKIVEDLPPQSHKHNVSKPVEIRGGANDDTTGTQNLPESFEYEITRYGRSEERRVGKE